MSRLFAALMFLFPSTCSALMTSQAGNDPLSPQNYVDWPNLVDAINDKSRIFMVWVNGYEEFTYNGDTDSANRVLKEFAETEFAQLQLVILPGPGRTQEIEKKPVRIDYRIEIYGGIARAALTRRETVRNLNPTMTIYLTENIELDKLVIPENVKLSQLPDLEAKYTAAIESEDESLRREASHYLEALHTEFRRKDSEYDELRSEIATIKAFIECCEQSRNPQ